MLGWRWWCPCSVPSRRRRLHDHLPLHRLRRLRDAGYAHAGYSARNDRMYWLMYSGHNCTNYAAYRMIKGGMSNERPWSGGGNA